MGIETHAWAIVLLIRMSFLVWIENYGFPFYRVILLCLETVLFSCSFCIVDRVSLYYMVFWGKEKNFPCFR